MSDTEQTEHTGKLGYEIPELNDKKLQKKQANALKNKVQYNNEACKNQIKQLNLQNLEGNVMKFFCTEDFYNMLNNDPELDAYIELHTKKPKNYNQENERAKANWEGVVASRKNIMLVLKALQTIYEPGKHIHTETLKTFHTYGHNGNKLYETPEEYANTQISYFTEKINEYTYHQWANLFKQGFIAKGNDNSFQGINLIWDETHPYVNKMKHMIKNASTWYNTSTTAENIKNFHAEKTDEERKTLPKEKQANIAKHSFRTFTPLSDIAKSDRLHYNQHIATAKKYLFENNIFNFSSVYTDAEIIETYKNHTNCDYIPLSKQIC